MWRAEDEVRGKNKVGRAHNTNCRRMCQVEYAMDGGQAVNAVYFYIHGLFDRKLAIAEGI